MVQIMVKRTRKAVKRGGLRVLCGECRYEFEPRKAARELLGPRRCPRCRVRLVEPGLGFLHGRDRRSDVRPRGGA